MPRFFVDEDNINGNKIIITGEDYNHIKKVLRLESGESITVCNGKGKDYLVRIESFEDNRIITDIIASENNKSEPEIEVILFQGMPKSDKMDLIIQKNIELGISTIYPVITERTVVKFNSQKDIDNKLKRWQRISLEAAKQCNRGIIPRVVTPVDFGTAIELAAKAQLSLIPYEKETSVSLKKYLHRNNAKSISIVIGPEGGFSEAEIERAESKGLKSVTLGPRIMRTETAGMVVLAALMYELGDMG